MSRFRELPDRALGWVRIQRRDDRLAFSWSPGWIITVLGTGLTIGIHLYLFSLFVSATMRFPYLSPVANVEEAAHTYIAGKNYRRFGFMNSLFLQDFSTGSDSADHPFVYTHMPAGPDILQGLLFIISDGSYAFSRITFALIFLIGLIAYWRFARDVLAVHGLSGAIFCVLTLEYWYVFNNYDRQPYSPFCLLAFLPPVSLQHYYRTGRRPYLYLTVAVAFISSIYLEYNLLSGVIWCWIMLWLTQILPVQRRHVMLVIGSILSGIGLHLVQDFLYLGPVTFFAELQLLLGNRMIGIPSQEEMRDFYQQIGVSHHGARALDIIVLLRQLLNQLTWTSREIVLSLLGVALVWRLLPSLRFDRTVVGFSVLRGTGTRDVSWFARLWLWIAGTVLLPNVMFPAFNQDVVFSGARSNMYFVSIGVIAVAAYAVRLVTAPFHVPGWPRSRVSVAVGLGGSRQTAIAAGDPLENGAALMHRPVRDAAMLAGTSGLMLLILVTFILVATRPDWYGIRLIAALGAISLAAIVALAMFSRSPALRVAHVLRHAGEGWWRLSADSRTTLVTRSHLALRWMMASVQILSEVAVRIVLVIGLFYLVRTDYALIVNHLQVIEGRVADLRMAYFGDLRPFAHQLNMTNVNSATIGFMIDEAGFGVCELESLPEEGGLDPSTCRIQYFRQRDYWLTKTPSYFFFFTSPEYFPGFGRCLPTGTGIPVERGGDSCVDEMRRRLATRATEIHSNPLFTVFDLKHPPDLAYRFSRDVPSPGNPSVVPVGRRAIQFAWSSPAQDLEYHVERKEQLAEPYKTIAVVTAPPTSHLSTSYLSEGLDGNTRYYFRVRACREGACSRYVYTDTRTPS